MELTPQTLHAVEFREARRGGYNTRDVDDFLERVAAGVGHLHERLREVGARAETAEARLLDAQRQLEDYQRQGPSAAPASSPGVQGAGVNETDDTLRRTLVLAQRTADATIKEAKQEANRLIDEARAEATRARMAAEDEARRGADHARASVEAELDGLVDQREALRADLDILNRHIDDQRERIRAGIAELRRIVEDDAQLTPGPVPAFADVDRPAAPPLPSRAAYGSPTGAATPTPTTRRRRTAREPGRSGRGPPGAARLRQRPVEPADALHGAGRRTPPGRHWERGTCPVAAVGAAHVGGRRAARPACRRRRRPLGRRTVGPGRRPAGPTAPTPRPSPRPGRASGAGPCSIPS